MTRYAYFILIPAFVFNVISQSSVPLSTTLTMVGYSVLTHIMVAIGAAIVGTILGRSREVIAAFVLISIFLAMLGTLGCLFWIFALVSYRKSRQLSIFFQS